MTHERQRPNDRDSNPLDSQHTIATAPAPVQRRADRTGAGISSMRLPARGTATSEASDVQLKAIDLSTDRRTAPSWEADYRDHWSLVTGQVVQAKAGADLAPSTTQDLAATGVEGPGSSLPHHNLIQASFGRHDISGIRAHVGGVAATAATAIGAEAYATGDAVAFRGTPDLHTAAHEAAHIIQQRAGVSLKGGVGQAGDPYEQHADAVADRVVAGESAEHLLDAHAGGDRSAFRVVQRFGSGEHTDAANLGSKHATYERAGMHLNHGDLTALRGDLFLEKELLERWNRPSSNPGQELGTQDEIIAAIKQGNAGDPRFAPSGPWHDLELSAAVKDAVDKRYQNLATHNTNHFAENTAGPHEHKELEGGSASATYREAHERAIRQAYQAGKRGQGIDTGMITEAMGQHFLTDAFAAGHLTTPRGDVLAYWNDKFPHFGQQFIDKLIRDVSAALDEQASGLSDAVPRSAIESTVKDTVEQVLRGSPKPSFGDIVSLVIHDIDNAAGVAVTNDLGMKWHAVGDGQLNKGNVQSMLHKTHVASAVEKGCDDIRAAYALGQAGFTDVGSLGGHAALYAAVRAQSPAPAKPGPKYAAEQLMPRLDEQAGAEQVESWRCDSIAQLWNTPVRPDEATYGARITKSVAKGGDIYETLEAVHSKLDERVNPFSAGHGKAVDIGIGALVWGLPGAVITGMDRAHGFLYPQKAFKTAVLDALNTNAKALRFLMGIVGE